MEFPSSLTDLRKYILPVVIGGGLGYAYYYFIGCVSGTCPITSNPWISTGYGALMGFLVGPRSSKKPVSTSTDKEQSVGRGEKEQRS